MQVSQSPSGRLRVSIRPAASSRSGSPEMLSPDARGDLSSAVLNALRATPKSWAATPATTSGEVPSSREPR